MYEDSYVNMPSWIVLLGCVLILIGMVMPDKEEYQYAYTYGFGGVIIVFWVLDKLTGL